MKRELESLGDGVRKRNLRKKGKTVAIQMEHFTSSGWMIVSFVASSDAK